MATERNSMESAELLRRIRDEIQRKVQQPTTEWKTALQWGKEWGLGRAQTNQMLTSAVKNGIMEFQTFRIPMPTRASYPVPHYRRKTP
jgi:hypothetical protein